MPQKPKSTIIPFPSSAKPIAVEENNVFAELKAALAAAEPVELPAPDGAAAPSQNASAVTLHIAIHGGTNQISTGAINNPTSLAKPSAAPDVAAKPVISMARKRQLRDLRDDIVAISTECEVPKHPASIMVALNSYMNVSKYDEILEADFEKARNHLLMRREALKSFRASLQARKDFRTQMIRAIRSHYEEMGQKSAVYGYLSAEFEKDLTLNLPTSQLEDLYRTVISEK